MVLYLKAQVAREEVKQRPAFDVRRSEQLAHVPAPPRLLGDLRLAEGVSLVWEVPAEDDRVRPHVAHYVGGEVGGQCSLEAASRERRECDVVLDDLPARL